MAEGHNISSTNLNENFQNSASSKSNSVQIQPTSINDTKYNNINDNLKLSWTGNLESLKYFIEKDINFNGTWKSPGGERKSCTDGKTTITWWRNKKASKYVALMLKILNNRSAIFYWEVIIAQTLKNLW